MALTKLNNLEEIPGTGAVGVYLYPNGNKITLQQETTADNWEDVQEFTKTISISLEIESGVAWRVNYGAIDTSAEAFVA